MNHLKIYGFIMGALNRRMTMQYGGLTLRMVNISVVRPVPRR